MKPGAAILACLIAGAALADDPPRRAEIPTADHDGQVRGQGPSVHLTVQLSPRTGTPVVLHGFMIAEEMTRVFVWAEGPGGSPDCRGTVTRSALGTDGAGRITCRSAGQPDLSFDMAAPREMWGRPSGTLRQSGVLSSAGQLDVRIAWALWRFPDAVPPIP
ncbi:hypothetical protein [Marivivens marinus]|uniref:hypothetical protein n=1 Tax=Marivivens marinus TaxID=3110173 RepID=UPI003B8453D6